jgi:hypothetical protein
MEGREHWYVCRGSQWRVISIGMEYVCTPGVITMTLGSSLSSLIWCHVNKIAYVGV